MWWHDGNLTLLAVGSALNAAGSTGMGWEGWVTIAVVVLLGLALVRQWASPDTTLMGGLTLLMTLGVFSAHHRLPSPGEAVAGFGNQSLITIAVLFVVAEGLSVTGAMTLVAQPLLGTPRTTRSALARMMFPVAGLSAFLNNTPIVAMFMPVVSDWCKKTHLSPSRLFIPLSYSAILGGVCTLVGTATNMLVQGEVRDARMAGVLDVFQNHDIHIGMFTITPVALPAALAGLVFLLLFSRKLLPDRGGATKDFADARRYTVELLVDPHSIIVGKSIEAAGLRNLPGTFLIEIERGGEHIVAPGPGQILRAHDRLIFAGVVESVIDLRRIRGLKPATDEVFKISTPAPNRRLVEAVVSPFCPLVGKTVKEGRFRTNYDAAIIAVHRDGKPLKMKIGEIVLRAGDTLLLETHPQFVEIQRNRRDFFLVSSVEGSEVIRHDRAWVALLIMFAMVAAATFEVLELVNAALLAAGLMLVTRCFQPYQARNAINWRVLMAMGAALGIGRAIHTSGAADTIAHGMVNTLAMFGPRGVLGAIALTTILFASTIGPMATALFLLPIGISAAAQLGVNPMPFIMTISMASAVSLSTPIAYQTNLMVYGPGGYHFTDFARIGLPVSLVVMTVAFLLAPVVWPF